MGLLDRAAVAALPFIPRPIMRSLASRYIAGETLESALEKLAALRAQGFTGILDILGEDLQDAAAARAVVGDYESASEALQARALEAYISIKPTHLGLRFSEDQCLDNYRRVASTCASRGQFVRVEMEDHTTTDATLRVFQRLWSEHADVGIVLQSRLFRTPADVARLLAERPAGRRLHVRMVKGIYLEPAEIAHIDAAPIRAAFLALSRTLLSAGARVSFATHDAAMAEDLIALVRELGLGPDAYEFQVPLGVQSQLWDRWKSAGHPVRVYVPFGPEWRAYSMRRLKKNPQIFWHVMRDMNPFTR